MATGRTFARGRSASHFFKLVTTIGSWEKPAAVDAAKVISLNMSAEEERINRMDSRQTRSLLERIAGKQTPTWDCEAYIVPSGTAGTPPDLHPLYYAALHGYANTPATSDVYSCANDESPQMATILQHWSDTYQQSIVSAWVEDMTISGSGTEPPKVRFSGGGFSYHDSSPSLADGAGVASDQLTPDGSPVDYSKALDINTIVKIGTEDNSGAGMHLLSKASGVFTLETTGSWSDQDSIVPFMPTETTAGSPIPGISGSSNLGGFSSICLTSFEVNLKNNNIVHDDVAFQKYACDVTPNWRDVTGTLTFRARDDFLRFYTYRRDFTQLDFAIVMGTTAGAICTIDMDQCELEWGSVDVPASGEEAAVTVPFRALGSSGEDELSITFT